MQPKTKEKSVSIMTEVPEEEETYPVYTNNGTINVTISGNNNMVTFLTGKPPNPPPPPGGGGQ